jgi:hypothetical protein
MNSPTSTDRLGPMAEEGDTGTGNETSTLGKIKRLGTTLFQVVMLPPTTQSDPKSQDDTIRPRQLKDNDSTKTKTQDKRQCPPGDDSSPKRKKSLFT